MENKVSYKIRATKDRLFPPMGSGVAWGDMGVREKGRGRRKR